MSCCRFCAITFLCLFLPLFLWLLACDSLHLPSLAFFDGDNPTCVRPRLFLMRFFRDLSRYKARKRLHTSTSLATLIMGNEELLKVRDHENSGDGTSFTMTEEELSEMNGENGHPIYLAIHGRIYDVSAGHNFYGKGRSYHHFVARDASRAFATNCKQPACLVPSLKGLSYQDQKEIDRWVELYEFHDKYTYIGKLVAGDPVDEAVEQAMLEEKVLLDVQQTAKKQNQDVVDALIQRGKQAYQEKDVDLAVFMWSAALVKLGAKTEINLNSGTNKPGLDWATAMMKRSKVLSFIAAAVQKRGSLKDMKEAIEHFAEAAESTKRVIEKFHMLQQDKCLLTEFWFVRARAEADCATVHVMSERKKRKLNLEDEVEVQVVNDVQDEVEVRTKKGGVEQFQTALETHANAYVAASMCKDDRAMTTKIRTGWINAYINLAHAHKNNGQYEDARFALTFVLDEKKGGPTVVTLEDVANSKVLAGLKKRARGFYEKLAKRQQLAKKPEL